MSALKALVAFLMSPSEYLMSRIFSHETFLASNGRRDFMFCSSSTLSQKIWWFYPFRHPHMRVAVFLCMRRCFWGIFDFFPRLGRLCRKSSKIEGFVGVLIVEKMVILFSTGVLIRFLFFPIFSTIHLHGLLYYNVFFPMAFVLWKK